MGCLMYARKHYMCLKYSEPPPSKLNIELPFDPEIPLLKLYPKNSETPIQKNLWTLMFIATQFTIANCWKKPKC